MATLHLYNPQYNQWFMYVTYTTGYSPSQPLSTWCMGRGCMIRQNFASTISSIHGASKLVSWKDFRDAGDTSLIGELHVAQGVLCASTIAMWLPALLWVSSVCFAGACGRRCERQCECKPAKHPVNSHVLMPMLKWVFHIFKLPTNSPSTVKIGLGYASFPILFSDPVKLLWDIPSTGSIT